MEFCYGDMINACSHDLLVQWDDVNFWSHPTRKVAGMTRVNRTHRYRTSLRAPGAYTRQNLDVERASDADENKTTISVNVRNAAIENRKTFRNFWSFRAGGGGGKIGIRQVHKVKFDRDALEGGDISQVHKV